MKKKIISTAMMIFCLAPAGKAVAASYEFKFEGPLAITEGDYVYADIDLGFLPEPVSDVNVYVDIDHTSIGDLDIYLVHQEFGQASWKWVQLYNQEDLFMANNLREVTFDDQADTSIDLVDPPYGPGLFRPTSRPEAGESNLLTDYNGDTAGGIWSLAFWDNYLDETGTLNEFRVDIETNPVPLPGTVLLFGSGLVALIGIGRQRGK